MPAFTSSMLLSGGEAQAADAEPSGVDQASAEAVVEVPAEALGHVKMRQTAAQAAARRLRSAQMQAQASGASASAAVGSKGKRQRSGEAHSSGTKRIRRRGRQ